jgi:hypothetical protein
VKTPFDTHKTAGLIQSFLLTKKIAVARCDALELAAQIKGYRDLHEDQASAPRNPSEYELETSSAVIFFTVLIEHLAANPVTADAIKVAVGVLPREFEWMNAYFENNFIRGKTSTEVFGEKMVEIGFPNYVGALWKETTRTGSVVRGLESIVKILEKAEPTMPLITLVRPQGLSIPMPA